jgi:excinuclease ABC subunit C
MDILKEKVNTLPHRPGVYIYRDIGNHILYVGKAVDLHRRVQQYFQRTSDLPVKIQSMVGQIHSIDIEETPTEFDALLLEAKRIREYQPKYNSIAKDDRSPIYIRISKDTLPYVDIGRKPKNKEKKIYRYLGPFQSGRTAESILKKIRSSIPFCSLRPRTGRACFYTHLGLCDPCPSVLSKMADTEILRSESARYRKNIRKILSILTGHSSTVIRTMEKEMKQAAKFGKFEDAARIRTEMQMLLHAYQNTYEPFRYETEEVDFSKNERDDLVRLLQPIYSSLRAISRIECYDISTIAGTYSVGSMVVNLNGVADKSSYRKFKINSENKQNDVAMMSEVLTRRLKHSEWNFPDLIIVDGGKGQLQEALTLLKNTHLDIPCLGLAKRQEQIIVRNNSKFLTLTLPLNRPALNLIRRIRDEAHRFAVSYHTLLRKKAFIQK